MDRTAIPAAEALVHGGYPHDVEALLIVELDGVETACDLLIEEVERIARANDALSCRISSSEEERLGEAKVALAFRVTPHGRLAGRKHDQIRVKTPSPESLCGSQPAVHDLATRHHPFERIRRSVAGKDQ